MYEKIFEETIVENVSSMEKETVNKAEIYGFPELSCVFHDPVDVGNLISGSSAFSKTSLTSGSKLFMYC